MLVATWALRVSKVLLTCVSVAVGVGALCIHCCCALPSTSSLALLGGTVVSLRSYSCLGLTRTNMGCWDLSWLSLKREQTGQPGMKSSGCARGRMARIRVQNATSRCIR